MKDRVSFYCFAKGHHKHRSHSENHQLNFLYDTYLTLIYNSAKKSEKDSHIANKV